MKKKRENVCRVIKKQYLCSVKNRTGGSVERLDYGVMVTQQILVLFFQVRVLVVQLKRGGSKELPLFSCVRLALIKRKLYRLSSLFLYCITPVIQMNH